MSYVKKCTLINNNLKIYRSYRHKTRSHRFTRNNIDTDESGNRQKSLNNGIRTYLERHENDLATGNLDETETRRTYSESETCTRSSFGIEPAIRS